MSRLRYADRAVPLVETIHNCESMTVAKVGLIAAVRAVPDSSSNAQASSIMTKLSESPCTAVGVGANGLRVDPVRL